MHLQAIALAVSCSHMHLLMRSSWYRWHSCVRNTFTVLDVSNHPSRAHLAAVLLLVRALARSAGECAPLAALHVSHT